MASARAAALRNQVVAAAFVFSFLLVAGAWFAGFASPDRLLERSYARVAPQGTLYLDDMGPDSQPALRVTKAAAMARVQPILAVDGTPMPSGILSEPLTVGERVRIRTGVTEFREVEILEVSELDAPLVGLPGLRLQFVMARPAGHHAQVHEQLIFAIRDAEPVKIVPAVSVPNQGRVL